MLLIEWFYEMMQRFFSRFICHVQDWTSYLIILFISKFQDMEAMEEEAMEEEATEGEATDVVDTVWLFPLK